MIAGFAGLLLAHNRHLFIDPIYEDGDFAANSLLVLKAKRLELLHGHYSRLGFYHPGPALLYMLAGAEWLFHDLLHVVPAPHNAHILAHLFLNAALAGISITVIARAAGARAGAAAAMVFMVYFAREGQLNVHWFAYTFFMIYLPFQVVAASVASGRSGHLGWLAFTGGLAVHSHVSFASFVPPITLYALVRLWAKSGYRLRSLPATERRDWIVFSAIVGLFVLPIALHFALHYPGEIGRYARFAERPDRRSGAPDEVATYLIRTLTHESEFGWRLVAGVVAAAALAVVTSRDPERPFARQLGVVALLTGSAMAYYAIRGVDDLSATYTGVFFSSTLLLCWTLIGMRVAAVLDRGPVWRGCVAAVCAGVVVWAAIYGAFRNLYPGEPATPALADAICADPRWESGPPCLTLNPKSWAQATGLLLQLERRGRRPWVLDRYWDPYCAELFRLDGRPVAVLWQIDLAQKDDQSDDVRRVLAEYGRTSVREVATRAPFGAPIPLGQGARIAGAKPEVGWAMIWGLPVLRPTRSEGSLLLDLDRCPTHDVRLTVTAEGIVHSLEFDGQKVGVVVNGCRVGELLFPRDQTCEQSLTFPGEVLDRHTPVRIEFVFPDAWKERDWRVARSRPWHSIWLKGLMFTPVRQ